MHKFFFNSFWLPSLIFILFHPSVAAHNPRESYCLVNIQDGDLYLRLDFSWSIQEAIQLANPQVEKNVDKEAFWELLVAYIKANLEVSMDGKKVDFTSIKEVPQAHGHSLILVLKYTRLPLEKIEFKNTLLFNYSSRQRNFHRFSWEGQKAEWHITSQEAPSFIISKKQAKISNQKYRWFFASSVLGLALALAFSSIYKNEAKK